MSIVSSDAIAQATASFLDQETRAPVINVSPNDLEQAGRTGHDWIVTGQNYAGTRYSPLDQIGVKNAKHLGVVWELPLSEEDALDTDIIVKDGVMYVTTANNSLWAINASNGAIYWGYERELPKDVHKSLCCGTGARGVAVFENKVFLPTLDGHLVALESSTGKVLWDVTLGDYVRGETLAAVPLVVKGQLIVGNSGGEFGVRGWIRAIDAATGAVLWSTYTVPDFANTWPGESWKFGGGASWASGVYDAERDLVFWAVGSPAPKYDRHVRQGSNLYTNSVLAIDPSSGQIRGFFSYTPNSPYGYDSATDVILIADGKSRKIVQSVPNGYVYAFEPDVSPRSDEPREFQCLWVTPIQSSNWSSALSTKNNCKPSYDWPRKDVGYDTVTTDIEPAALAPMDHKRAVAYSERSRLVYATSQNSRMDLQSKRMEWRRGEWYLGAHVLNIQLAKSRLTAVDPSTGRTKWTYESNVQLTSGLLSTKGGIVFLGNESGDLVVFSDDKGSVVTKIPLGTPIRGNPVTYSVDGVQYVAVTHGTSKYASSDTARRMTPGSSNPGPGRSVSGVTALAVEDPKRVPVAQNVEVLFATDRVVLKDASIGRPLVLSPSGVAEKVSFGRIVVNVPSRRKIGTLKLPSQYLVTSFVPQSDSDVFRVKKIDVFSSEDEFFDALRRHRFADNGVLLFIHGFNVAFEEAALRTAQLVVDSKFRGIPMMFSWPSAGDGSFFSAINPTVYSTDEETVRLSKHHLKDVIRGSLLKGPVTKLFVVAHSMGSRPTTMALAEILREIGTDFRSRVKEIVLAAADVFPDELEREGIPAILSGSRGPKSTGQSNARVTVYTSDNDWALRVSNWIHGKRQRLGQSSPDIFVFDGFETVDASNVESKDLFKHSYILNSEQLLRDLYFLISQGLGAEARFLGRKDNKGRSFFFFQ